MPIVSSPLLLIMPERRSTYGPQTPSDMWSLPQDVTIATDPLGLEEWFCGAGAGAQLWSDGRGVEAVIQSASLTSCMALQGYGDDLAGRMNEVNLVDLFPSHCSTRDTTDN